MWWINQKSETTCNYPKQDTRIHDPTGAAVQASVRPVFSALRPSYHTALPESSQDWPYKKIWVSQFWCCHARKFLNQLFATFGEIVIEILTDQEQFVIDLS
jgi:hypothetical protein